MVDANVKLLSVPELVASFEHGPLREKYTDGIIFPEAPRGETFFVSEDNPQARSSDDAVNVWFGEETLQRKEENEFSFTKDGFYPRCDSFEYTVLWLHIVSNYFDYYETGDWSVEHGGLRWEYYGDAADEPNLHSTIETLWPLAYAKYVAVAEALVAGGNVKAYVSGSR